MSVPTADRVQATFCATLVDEWVRGGVTDAVVCPGSRSTPLALALAERREIALHVRLDERGAGFFALGMALRSERPVVVCTTSGTAAAELHPAVVEADLARVPLLVCTADRPPELHHVGAPQTMEQRGLYGGATRWAVDPGVPEAAAQATWRSLAARAVAEAWHGPAGPGPVHLCLPFRDPLAAPAGALPPGRADGRPWHQVVDDATSPVPSTVDGGLGRQGIVEGWPGRRGIVVAGAGAAQGADPQSVLALARALGWPVLADPRSGCRRPDPVAVGAADAILRDPGACAALRPEVVLLLGAPWASKVLAQFVAASAAAGAAVCAVDPWWRWVDPDRVAATVVRAAPGRWAQAVTERLGGATATPWLARWSGVEAAAQQAMDGALAAEADGAGVVPEPLLARRLLAAVPATATVVASSSMPVRDLEWYGPPVDRPPTVLANRGVNGIDGVCSTALGAAAVAPGPVVGLVGDLAFLHDASALAQPVGPPITEAAVTPAGAACTLVVPDNHGGGIFSFLPQAAQLEGGRFEQLFGTPHQADVAAVARGFGLACTEVESVAELDAALQAIGSPDTTGVSVVRVRVPSRPENVAVHDRVHRAVADAVATALRAG